MKKVAGTVVQVVVGLCFLGGCGEGLDAQWEATTEEIVGGSTYTGLPAVGLITYDGYAHCTGTVIAPRLVVTAAHCVERYEAAKLRFVIGDGLGEAKSTINVTAAIPHPQFDRFLVMNDIGMLRLDRDAPVTPLGVLRSMDSTFRGRELFFVGFGADDGKELTGGGKKRAVWIKISEVSDLTFRYDDPARNTCNGDSGGPALVVDPKGGYLVAGVTSFGDTWCASYGVDTRVDRYLSFLGI